MGGSNRPVRVMRIGANGTWRVQLAATFLVEGLAWSPNGRSVAVLTACPSDAPLARTPDGRELIVAIHYDDCGLSTRDRSGRATPEASFAGLVAEATRLSRA